MAVDVAFRRAALSSAQGSGCRMDLWSWLSTWRRRRGGEGTSERAVAAAECSRALSGESRGRCGGLNAQRTPAGSRARGVHRPGRLQVAGCQRFPGEATDLRVLTPRVADACKTQRELTLLKSAWLCTNVLQFTRQRTTSWISFTNFLLAWIRWAEFPHLFFANNNNRVELFVIYG